MEGNSSRNHIASNNSIQKNYSRSNSQSAYMERIEKLLEKVNDTSATRITSDQASNHSFTDDNNGKAKDNATIYHTKAVVTRPAPYFEGTAVINEEFKILSLSDYLGKYVVFFFYPLDFTFVCPTEIIAFSDRSHEFKKINTEIIACSVDSQFSHLAWTKTTKKNGGLGKIKIPLLSDMTHKISKDYGVYLEKLGHSSRGLFIIDHSGIIRQITINDLPVGRSVDEILRLVQAFQFTDSHGEVCPAGWKPNDKTIVPDIENAKKYFQNNYDII